MPRKLVGLQYRRIDLVDKGANQAALVTLCKRAGHEREGDMAEKKEPTVAELQKQLDAQKTTAEADTKKAVDKALADAKAEADKKADEAKADLAKSADQKAKEAIAKKEAEVTAAVKKADEAIAVAKRLQDEKDLDRAITFVKSLGGLATVDDHAEPIRKMRNWDKDAAESIEKLLTKAKASVDAAIAIAPRGRDGERNSSVTKAGSEFSTLVKKHAADNKVSEPVATMAVMETDAGRKLYAESKGE